MHTKKRLLTPGPTPLPEKVRLALARDMLHHRKTDFRSIYQKTQHKLQQLFATEQPVLALSCSGTGAMQAAVNNLFAPGEKVLIASAGKFGQRWTDLARHRNLDVRHLSLPWGEAFNARQIQEILNQNPDVSGLLLQASETSTGVLHPIREIADLTRKQDVLLVVDGISTVGISPCPLDEWGIDCLLTASQKGLMLPPGLGLISLSEKAWQKVAQTAPRDYYFDLLLEKESCLKGQTRFTSPVNLILGLDAALEIFFEQGLENIYRKHWALTQMVRAGIKSLGLELFAPEHYTWGLTSIHLPSGIDSRQLLDKAHSDYGVIFAGGQDRLKNRLVRIGHMGHVDFADLLAGLYALRKSYLSCGGFSGSENYLEVALEAYEQALGNFKRPQP